MTMQKENAPSIVEEAIELQAPHARERGVMLEASGPEGTMFVNGDRNRLLQVLGNLIGNALRFTPEGGRITVRIDDQDNDRLVRFVVDDTGTGIKPEHLPHVFEQYWKGDSKRNRAWALHRPEHRAGARRRNRRQESARPRRFFLFHGSLMDRSSPQYTGAGKPRSAWAKRLPWNRSPPRSLRQSRSSGTSTPSAMISVLMSRQSVANEWKSFCFTGES